ncbi:MAG: hypothetical protein AB7C97_05805 [Oscillospiraceae bacterium]
MKKSMKRAVSLLIVMALIVGTMTAALAKTTSETIDAPADTTVVFTITLGTVNITYTWADISGSGSFASVTNTYGAKDADGNLSTIDYTGIPLSDLLADAAAKSGFALSDGLLIKAAATDGYVVAFTVGDVRDDANHYLVATDPVKNSDGDTVYDNSYVRIVRGDADTTPNNVNIRCVTGIQIPDAGKTPDAGAAVLSKQTVTFNGSSVALEAYNIDGYNYFKLRDIAYLLNGTSSQFSISVSDESFAVNAVKGSAYTAVGGELEPGTDKSASCVASVWKLSVDGTPCSAYVYNLDGNNFFKLRDLGTAFSFGVDYDAATNTVAIMSADYSA